MNDLLDLPSLAFSAFKFDDNAADAAVSEIIRLGGHYLTDIEFEHCALAACGLKHVWPKTSEERKAMAASVYTLLKPLRKPLNSRDL